MKTFLGVLAIAVITASAFDLLSWSTSGWIILLVFTAAVVIHFLYFANSSWREEHYQHKWAGIVALVIAVSVFSMGLVGIVIGLA